MKSLTTTLAFMFVFLCGVGIGIITEIEKEKIKGLLVRGFIIWYLTAFFVIIFLLWYFHNA